MISSYIIDPKTSLRLYVESKAAKTYYALTLSSAPFSKTEIIEGLLKTDIKNNYKEEILRYFDGLDIIRSRWNLNLKEFTVSDCLDLYRASCFGRLKSDDSSDLKHILSYIQVSREHPLVKAALAYILCFKIGPFTQNSRRFSHLLFDFFLAKEGANSKGLFCIDHYFYDHKQEFEQTLDFAYKQDNLTTWLEYVTSSALSQMKFLEDVVKQKGTLFRTGIPKRYWALTKRQQKVAGISLIPQARITNKKVQELFGVSQITASRDLSKLEIVGILEHHGKGRSVYYTV